MIMWCPACTKFVVVNQNMIKGHGATLIVKGGIFFPCPHCGGRASTPGGEFRVEHDTIIRVSDNLSKTQAGELKSRLASLNEHGYSINVLKEIVESYAPQLLTYVQALDKGDAPSRTRWVLLLFFILWQIANNTTCSLDMKLDMNRLLDNSVRQTNQKIAPAAKSSSQPGRNDPCPCGSGKKFKKCCGK